MEDRRIDDIIIKTFFNSLFYYLYICSVTDHRGRQNVVRTSVTHSAAPCVPLFCSYHILTSSVIYYWTDTWQLGIYLLNRQGTSRNIFTCNVYLYTRRSILKIFLTPSAFLYRRWVSCYMCMWKRPQPYCQCAKIWVDRSRFKPGGSLCCVLGQNT